MARAREIGRGGWGGGGVKALGFKSRHAELPLTASGAGAAWLGERKVRGANTVHPLCWSPLIEELAVFALHRVELLFTH